MNKHSESGRSMVEMLGVLAIIGVLSVGAFSAVSYGMRSYRATWAYQLVEDTAQGVNDLYSWSRSLDTNPETMATRICENDVVEGTCTKKAVGGKQAATTTTPWGEFQVMADSGTQYKMILTDVPETICDRLKEMSWSEYVEWVSPETCGNSQSITFIGY